MTTATWRALGTGGAYLTMAETVLGNAFRHMRSAGEHAASGRLDNADGSAEKASKNLRLYLRLTE